MIEAHNLGHIRIILIHVINKFVAQQESVKGSTPRSTRLGDMTWSWSIEVLELPAPTQGTALHTSESTRHSTHIQHNT